MERWLRAATLAAGMVAAIGFAPAHAEDAVATSLDTSEAQDFVGLWDMAVDFMGNEVHMDLNIVDVDGKLGATIDNERQPEAMAVQEIEKTEEGIKLLYEMSFGGNSFRVAIDAAQEGDTLVGKLSEQSGLFSADFTAEKTELDPEASEQRRRGRRRGASTQARLSVGDKRILVSFAELRANSDDYKTFENLKQGDVFEYVGGRATKLFTDFDLKFGDSLVKYGNASPEYPGVYSVWLKKADDGWKFVFNEEADIWGTMYNPEANAVEVAATEGTRAEPSERFVVELEQTDNGGVMKFAWGDREFAAPFTMEGVTAEDLAAADTTPPKISQEVLSEIIGTWNVTAQSQAGPLDQEFVVANDGQITVISDGQSSEPSELVSEGETVSFDIRIQGFDLTFKGTFDDGEVTGDYEMNGQSVAKITGAKVTD